MIIDCHVHVLPQRVRDNLGLIAGADPWFGACHARGERVASAESLLDAMDAAGVERSVCFTWPFRDPALCAEANDWLAGECRRHPDRLVGFGVVQPGDPAAAAEVERCARLGLRGIGEMNADAQGWEVLGADADAVVASSVATGLPWNLHCSEPVGHSYPGKGATTPDVVAAFASRHPDLTLVCAHLGGGLPLFASMPEVGRLCERLHFDTAAQPFVYDAAVYRSLVAAVGAERILLGSDHPLLDVGRYLEAMQGAGVGADDLALIAGGNAARLLGL